jgi:hypothetical protein
MEAKKGFLAIGIIVFVCICAAAVLAFLGWNWLNNSGALNAFTQGFSTPPIAIERSEFEAYIDNLGYVCDSAEIPAYGDFEFFACTKQMQGETFDLGVTYSKKLNQLISANASVSQSGTEGQKEIVAAAFAELARIPYKGSKPDEAAAWMIQCMKFEGIDTLNSTKSISGVTFAFYLYEGRYQLAIGSEKDYE